MLFPLPIKISPENQFLLLCARLNGAEEEREMLTRLLAGALNWDLIYQGIENNGIASLVYYNLKKHEAQSLIPGVVWGRLEKDFANYKQQVMLQRFELWRLLDSFHKANIPVIPLKGAFLRETVYPAPALRVSEDLDLLIQPKDLDSAKQVLTSLGRFPDISPYATDQYNPEKRHHLVPYILSKQDVRVEVHWNIARPSQLLKVDVEGLWERSIQGSIVDAPAYLLSPEDLLLHLSLHAAAYEKNKFIQPLVYLRQVIDIAGTVQFYKDHIDWQCVVRRAREWGAQAPLFIMLSLARDLLGAQEVEPALAEIAPSKSAISDLIAARKAVLRMTEVSMTGTETGALAQFKLADSKWGKAKLLWKTLFADPDVIASRYLISKGSKRLILFSLLNPLFLIYRFVNIRFFKREN